MPASAKAYGEQLRVCLACPPPRFCVSKLLSKHAQGFRQPSPELPKAGLRPIWVHLDIDSHDQCTRANAAPQGCHGHVAANQRGGTGRVLGRQKEPTCSLRARFRLQAGLSVARHEPGCLRARISQNSQAGPGTRSDLHNLMGELEVLKGRSAPSQLASKRPQMRTAPAGRKRRIPRHLSERKACNLHSWLLHVDATRPPESSNNTMLERNKVQP